MPAATTRLRTSIASTEAAMGSLEAEAATPPPFSTDVSQRAIAPVAGASFESLIGRHPSLRIAELGMEHQAAFRDLLTGVDEPSCFGGFCDSFGDNNPTRHCQLAFASATWIAGAFVQDRLRGVVELYEQACPQDLEAAFIVAEGWRRRGLGTALLHTAIKWARRSGRARLRMFFSRHNWAMRGLAGKADAKLDLVLDELVAEVAAGPAALASIHSTRPAAPTDQSM
jgi:GNAT superfamily N-acetyltransferase